MDRSRAPAGGRRRSLRWSVAATAFVGLIAAASLLYAAHGSAASTRHSRAQAATAGAITAAMACSQLQSTDFSSVPGATSQVTSTSTITYNGASYCDVTGFIAPQEQFDIRLPTSTWTGDYVQEGCGGQCGVVSITAPTASQDCMPVTGNQVVLATDNMGHIGEAMPIWAANDIALRVSYGYSSEHALAQLSKAVIAAYYGTGPKYSYYDGCSTGGREALEEAQRYPADFNGILAGAPTNDLLALSAEAHGWNILANTAANGTEILTSEKLPALHAAVMAKCANAQGVIVDPRSCDFDPASIQCPSGVNNTSCLTSAQVAAARRLYAGPTDPQGDLLYPGGMPYGSELAWPGTLIDASTDTAFPNDLQDYQFAYGVLRFEALDHTLPPSFKLSDFKFTRQEFDQLSKLDGLYDATDPDLSAFRRDGGKLIIWQGWADQAVPPTGTVHFYSAVVKAAGGYASSQTFTRLYMIPGGYHCLSGGAPASNGDLLTPLFNWVQNGQAPGTVRFPLSTPTSTLSALQVSPLNPDAPPPGGAKGLNSNVSSYIGRYRTGQEMWCDTDGMHSSCRVGRTDPNPGTD
jgi:Tannase and feruloyl esterase